MLNKTDILKIGKILNIKNIMNFASWNKKYKQYDLSITDKTISFEEMKKIEDAGYSIIFSMFNSLDIY